MKSIKIIAVIFSLLTLCGCFSIRLEDRVHSKGFYFSFNHKERKGESISAKDITAPDSAANEAIKNHNDVIPEEDADGSASLNLPENHLTKTPVLNERKIGKQVPLIKLYKRSEQIIKLKSKQEEPDKNGEMIGLLSMILGIISIPLLFLFLIGVPLAIAAIILGANGIKRNSGPEDRVGRVFSKVGLITGIITLSLFLLFILLVIIFLATWGGIGI